jgi:hypothetical protein
MSKEFGRLSAPHGVTVDLVSNEEYDTYQKAFKGAVHGLIIPFILGWFFPLAATTYFVAVVILYSTVFRKKSQGFWAVVGIVFLISVLLIIS